NRLAVVTGDSGSGKSSVAFDTIYAEGQRRYVESLSAYARQFLERMDKADVDEVLGIFPAIEINHKDSTRNPRATVARQTGINDYLRLLCARVGVTICRQCGNEVDRDTPQSVADAVMRLPQATRFYVLFPASAGAIASEAETEVAANGSKPKRSRKVKNKINAKAHLMSLMGRGFTRLYDATKKDVIDLETPDSYEKDHFDNVFVLVDRLSVRADSLSRLVDSLEICYREGHGQAAIQTVGDQEQMLAFSEKFECKNCGL